ncbi:MAG: hypothetical protein NVSMB57_11800 [Actinomycetota bacterium]
MAEHAKTTSAKAHIPRLIKNREVHPHTGFNRWLAVKLTNGVGTMWCAYFFMAIALVALPQTISDTFKDGAFHPLVLVSWISQTFIQLVMLSVIMVGQNVISAGQDARAEADHKTLGAIHELDKAIHDITSEIKALNDKQLELLQRR